MGRSTLRRGINTSMRATNVANFVRKMRDEREEEDKFKGGKQKTRRNKHEVILPHQSLSEFEVGNSGKLWLGQE